MAAIPCVIMRGGTSKGVYINGAHLPAEAEARDTLLCNLFGSSDPRQIDGIGGGDPLTSKVAILAAPSHPDADVDYISGEVRLRRHEVNYGIMCGNLAAGVGPAAVQMGLVDPQKCSHSVKVFNRNSGSVIDAHYQQPLDSELGTCFSAKLIFNNPIGNHTGCLLPTGNPVDMVSIRGITVKYSVVDAGAVYAFVSANELDLKGCETPAEIDAKVLVREWVELFRQHVAETINCLQVASKQVNIGQIKIALVSASANDSLAQTNIVGRIINPAKTHKAYAVSGAIATCVAASTSKTIVQSMSSGVFGLGAGFKIGHPEGVLEVGVQYDETEHGAVIRAAEIYRTSRLLMVGQAFTPLQDSMLSSVGAQEIENIL